MDSSGRVVSLSVYLSTACLLGWLAVHTYMHVIYDTGYIYTYKLCGMIGSVAIYQIYPV